MGIKISGQIDKKWNWKKIDIECECGYKMIVETDVNSRITGLTCKQCGLKLKEREK